MRPEISCGYWNASRNAHFLPNHTDPGLELVYVSNGQVEWDYSGQYLTTPAGYVSFSWPWQVHAARGGHLPPVELYWVLLPLINQSGHSPNKPGKLRFHPQLPITQPEGQALLEDLRQMNHPRLKMRGSFKNYFIRLVDGLRRNDNVYDLETSGWLQLCLAELQTAVQNVEPNNPRERQCQLVQEFIDNQLTSSCEAPWSLEEMAAQCDMGRTLFSDCVKLVSGDTPIRILTRKRVDRARNLLTTTNKSITEIAFRCGFSSSQHFATTFKTFTKSSPSSYRNRSL